MRQVTSNGSAKAFYLDRNTVLERLRTASEEAVRLFPEVIEILLFGSLATETHTGLSDIDLAVVLSATSEGADPLEQARPFHRHFQERLPISVDVLVFPQTERPRMQTLLENAVTLARRAR
jgi:predicted nucleotidyltransferase